MTALEVTKVMGTQFVAIEFNNDIKWSGRANQFTHWAWDYEVKSIRVAHNPTGATIIEVEA